MLFVYVSFYAILIKSIVENWLNDYIFLIFKKGFIYCNNFRFHECFYLSFFDIEKTALKIFECKNHQVENNLFYWSERYNTYIQSNSNFQNPLITILTHLT